MAELPTGTVTFLFTDIEGSTRLWEQHPDAMRRALAQHDTLLRAAIESHGGYVFQTMGDQFCAAFATAPAAAAAALAAQRALLQDFGFRISDLGSGTAEPDKMPRIERIGLTDHSHHTHPVHPVKVPESETRDPIVLRVRMALHTGAIEVRGGEYFGPALNRVARLLDAGHGGQTLLTLTTAELLRDAMPPGAELRDLGALRLKDLHQPEQLFQLVHPDLPDRFAALRSLEAFPHNLPAQLTRFIGREREIAEIKRLLAPQGSGIQVLSSDSKSDRSDRSDPSEPDPLNTRKPEHPSARLLTLTGSGGCGKTRLALQVAADLVGEFPDGVWLVELAPLADPALVPQAVASTLGVPEEPGRPILETLTDHLQFRSLLLVLDNCEHLLAPCAQLAHSLIRSCRALKILATSREGLGIAGETTYRLPSLSVPDPGSWSMVNGQGLTGIGPIVGHEPSTLNPQPSTLLQFESVRLFLDRATAAAPSFCLTDQNAPAVAQVCHRLDGIPLAIELAAARVRVLTVEKIAERLDDRFRLLTGGSRTALPRQQTLRALIDWSYDLLSDAERTLLRRLSVFAGGWTLEAAEAVCADDEGGGGGGGGVVNPAPSPHHLTTPPPHHLATGDVLDLLTSLVDKSLVLYEAGAGAPEGVGPVPGRLDGEADSAGECDERSERACTPGGAEARYRLLETMRQYGLDRLVEADEAAITRDSHLAFFAGLAEEAAPHLNGGPGQAAWLRRLEVEHDNLRAALEWSLTTSSPHHLTAPEAGLRLAAAVAEFWVMRNYLREGRDRLEAALASSTNAPAAVRGRALLGAGWLSYHLGDIPTAERMYQQGLEQFQEEGGPGDIADALDALGTAAHKRHDLVRARSFYEEALRIRTEVGERREVGWSLMRLGALARDQSDFPVARARYEESLAALREAGDQRGLSAALVHLAQIAFYQGDYAAARPLYEETLTALRTLSQKQGMAGAHFGLALVARCQGDHAAARVHFTESLSRFREAENRAGVGWAVLGLGNVAADQHEPDTARSHYSESLAIFQELDVKEGIAAVLERFAALRAPAADARDARRALHLFGAADVLREAVPDPLQPVECEEYEKRVFGPARVALGETAFAAAWAEGRKLSLEQAIRFALEE